MPKYIPGKIRCYDLKKKEIIHLSKEEYEKKSEDIIKSSKYQVVVKDFNNNKFTVFKDDPRLFSQELFVAQAKHFFNCNLHGKQIVENQKRLRSAKIPEEFKMLCPKCRDFYLSDQYIPSIKEIEACKKALKKIIFVSSSQQTPLYFKKYMPQFFKIVNNFSLPHLNLRFSDKIYFIKNNISKIPICEKNGCTENKELLVSTSSFGFTKYCKKHKYLDFSSDGEKEVFNFLREIYKGEILQNFRGFQNIELDIYLPDQKLGIEYNGLYWHSEKFKNKKDHVRKTNFFKERGIHIITIWEDDWKYKNGIIKSILRNKLKQNIFRIFARNCEIKYVNAINKKNFLLKNHIQGDCLSSINIGLYNNNELVSIMTFGKKRMIFKGNARGYELLRFCNKLDTSIVGGASKLFSVFVKKYNSENIISFANRDISQGDLYYRLGFSHIKDTDPNYWWIKDGKKYHRSNFMKHKLVKEGFDKNKSEDQIMRERGFIKLWGNGNIKFEKRG